MLLQRADKMFTSSDWLYEPKWDGFRTLAWVRDDGTVRLISRNGHPFTHVFGRSPTRGFPTSALLDGEVIDVNDRTSQTSRHPGQSSREAYEPEDA